MKLGPLKYRELIAKLKRFGLNGPFLGGKHPYFLLKNRAITVPNPHGRDVGLKNLKDIIKLLGITEKEFLEL